MILLTAVPEFLDGKSSANNLSNASLNVEGLGSTEVVAPGEYDFTDSKGSLVVVPEVPEVKSSTATEHNGSLYENAKSRKRKRISSSECNLDTSGQLKETSASARDQCKDFSEPLRKSSRQTGNLRCYLF